jgi:UrcA family protein
MKRNYAVRKSVITVLAAPLAFIGTLGAAATSAAAATPAETPSVLVPYGDLDTDSPAGAAALEQRIEAAASEVCERPDIRSVRQMAAWEECKATAKAGALEQIAVLEPYQSFALASVF